MVYKNLIGGQWVEAESGRTFKSVNPADTSDILGEFPASDARDVEQAVAAAARAFKEWKKVPAPQRGERLIEVAEVLKERKEELAKLLAREMGKILAEARGEIEAGIEMTYYMAGEGRRLRGYTTPSGVRNKAAYAIRQPIGQIAAITPWNFPFVIPVWKIMPALIAGNTIVWKPASDTPRVAYELAKIMHEGGVPEGVLNLIMGSGNDVGVPLAKHKKIDMISFTGSTEIGREIYRFGAEKLISVHLEMGGKNPIIILEDADIDLAIKGVIKSAFGTTGQRCTACSRVIAEDSIYDELLERLVNAANKLKLGNGLDASVDIGPIVNETQLNKIHQYVKIGVQEGAKLLCGGERATEGELSKGFFYRPTIFADVTPQMRIAQEEIFGPVLAILKARNYEDAIKIANGTNYGLSAAIYTKDINKSHKAIEDLEAGIVNINSGTAGAETHLPFGGVKWTGNGGRECGEAAVDEYSEWKTVFIEYSGG